MGKEEPTTHGYLESKPRIPSSELNSLQHATSLSLFFPLHFPLTFAF